MVENIVVPRVFMFLSYAFDVGLLRQVQNRSQQLHDQALVANPFSCSCFLLRHNDILDTNA